MVLVFFVAHLTRLGGWFFVTDKKPFLGDEKTVLAFSVCLLFVDLQKKVGGTGFLSLVWSCVPDVSSWWRKKCSPIGIISHRISEKRLTHNPKNAVLDALDSTKFPMSFTQKKILQNPAPPEQKENSLKSLHTYNQPARNQQPTPPIKIPKKPQHNPRNHPHGTHAFPTSVWFVSGLSPTVSFTAPLATRPAPATRSSARAILRIRRVETTPPREPKNPQSQRLEPPTTGCFVWIFRWFSCFSFWGGLYGSFFWWTSQLSRWLPGVSKKICPPLEKTGWEDVKSFGPPSRWEMDYKLATGSHRKNKKQSWQVDVQVYIKMMILRM